jgi:hypothetical protein
MYWRREDVGLYPGRAVMVVPLGDGNGGNMSLCRGNVALVCSEIVSFIKGHSGLIRARQVAEYAAEFILFKRARAEQHFTSVCADWDAIRCKHYGEQRRGPLSCDEVRDFERRVSQARQGQQSYDKLTTHEGTVLARHASYLFVAQAERCALSGIQLSTTGPDSMCQASVDRIDSTGRHVPGNVRLVTAAMNSARGNKRDDIFDDLILMMARYRGGV